jgi:hypothetical protein
MTSIATTPPEGGEGSAARVAAELRGWDARLYVTKLGTEHFSAQIVGPQTSVLRFADSQIRAIDLSLRDYRDFTGQAEWPR